jgi:hypothetical protein
MQAPGTPHFASEDVGDRPSVEMPAMELPVMSPVEPAGVFGNCNPIIFEAPEQERITPAALTKGELSSAKSARIPL